MPWMACACPGWLGWAGLTVRAALCCAVVGVCSCETRDGGLLRLSETVPPIVGARQIKKEGGVTTNNCKNFRRKQQQQQCCVEPHEYSRCSRPYRPRHLLLTTGHSLAATPRNLLFGDHEAHKAVRVRLGGGAVVSAVKRKIFWLFVPNSCPVSRRNEQWPQRHASGGPPSCPALLSGACAVFNQSRRRRMPGLWRAVSQGGREVQTEARSRCRWCRSARPFRCLSSETRHGILHGTVQCTTCFHAAGRTLPGVWYSTVQYSAVQPA